MVHPRNTRTKIFVALLLTFAAGYVDAAGFLLFWHVFTAHMTGNTVHFGIDAVEKHWTDALRACLPIPVFLVGSLLGRCLLEFGALHKWRRVASLILLVEAGAISAVIWLNLQRSTEPWLWTSLLLLALCMGLQTAALTRIGPLTVHTTFVTGMLNSLAQRLSLVVFGITDILRSQGTAPVASVLHTRMAREALLLLSVWLAYVTGGVCGAAATLRWKALALVAVLAMLLFAVCVDFYHPLSMEEEEEQAKQEIPLGELRRAG